MSATSFRGKAADRGANVLHSLVVVKTSLLLVLRGA